MLPQADLVKADLDKLSAALTRLRRHVMAIKGALTVGDYLAMAKDWLASSRVESFDIAPWAPTGRVPATGLPGCTAAWTT